MSKDDLFCIDKRRDDYRVVLRKEKDYRPIATDFEADADRGYSGDQAGEV